MIGDITVQFKITGPNGTSITLSRSEAIHLKAQLLLALRTTGRPERAHEERVTTRQTTLTVQK